MGLINPSLNVFSSLGVEDLRARREFINNNPSSSLYTVGEQFSVSATTTTRTAGNATSLPVVNIATSASSGNSATVSGFGTGSMGPSIMLAATVAIPTLTSVRVWFHIGTQATSASDTPPNNTVGFRFSTNVPDTAWQCFNRDASATSLITSGITVAAATAYNLSLLYVPGTGTTFFINGINVATRTANMPSISAATVSYRAAVTTLTTAARSLDVAQVNMRAWFI